MSQDHGLYAEVGDATKSHLMSTFGGSPNYRPPCNGDPAPYATTTLAMQNRIRTLVSPEMSSRYKKKVDNYRISGFLQNGNTFISLPQSEAQQDFFSRTTSSTEADNKRLPPTSTNSSISQNSPFFVPNWSEIFPPPPPEQPPPIPRSQNSSPLTSSMFNFRQQVRRKVKLCTASKIVLGRT